MDLYWLGIGAHDDPMDLVVQVNDGYNIIPGQRQSAKIEQLAERIHFNQSLSRRSHLEHVVKSPDHWCSISMTMTTLKLALPNLTQPLTHNSFRFHSGTP